MNNTVRFQLICQIKSRGYFPGNNAPLYNEPAHEKQNQQVQRIDEVKAHFEGFAPLAVV